MGTNIVTANKHGISQLVRSYTSASVGLLGAELGIYRIPSEMTELPIPALYTAVWCIGGKKIIITLQYVFDIVQTKMLLDKELE